MTGAVIWRASTAWELIIERFALGAVASRRPGRAGLVGGNSRRLAAD